MLIKKLSKKGMGWPSAPYYKAASGAATFAGDIIPGFRAWYGLRAYTAAYAAPGTNPCCDLVDQAKNNLTTFNILSSGLVDVASIAAWVTANSVTTIKVAQLYDQTGNALHIFTSGAGGTLATMPTMVLSGFGSFPIIHFDGSIPQELNAQGGTLGAGLNDPSSLYSVAKATTTNSVKAAMSASSPLSGLFWDGANILALFNGAGVVDFTSSATDGTFWTMLGVMNGASSIGQFANTATNPLSSSPGSAGLSGVPGVSNTSFAATMDWLEGGFIAGDKSASFNALNSNAKTFWGY